MNETIVKFEGLPQEFDKNGMLLRLLAALQCSPERWQEVLRCASTYPAMDACQRRLEEKCRTLEGQCEILMRLVRHNCCPANVTFSQMTVDDYSHEGQVNLDQIVTNLGGDFINTFPIPPNGKKLRLQQPGRPGWTPVEIRVDLHLTNGATNYLDLDVEFYLGPGDNQKGKKVGSTYKGNQFLNKNGTQIRVPFPEYKGQKIDVGSLEKLAVEITNRSGGNTNVESAQVVVLYDNNHFYKLCAGTACKTGCLPESSC